MKQLRNKNLLWPVALLFVCLIAYLPVSSFLFALKNDAFLYNFPNKFFFSEALHAGYLPAWNPYLNYGFPLYADPGFAWWHPLTWIFSFIGYNAYTFTIEVLLYIYISGLGMYWLGKILGHHPATAFAMGCMFMCSGFFIGNLQHVNFLTCAAFLPWLIGAWLLYQRTPSITTLSRCGVAVYLLCTGGHPAIPIATVYFMVLVSVLHFLLVQKKPLMAFLRQQLTLVVFSVLLLLPVLLSYWQLLPLYTRNEPIVQAGSLDVGFTLSSCISFLFPFATIKNGAWFGTDVSMRNAYFSIPGFVFLLQFLFRKEKKPMQTIFLLAGATMLLLSAGGAIKKTIYQTLPLLQFIRTNGEFRVFTVFGFLICASYELNGLVLKKERLAGSLKIFFQSIAVIAGITALLFFLLAERNQPLFSTNSLSPALLKAIIDTISFRQTVFIASIDTLLFCLLYSFALYKKKGLYFISVLLLDVILNSWLLLPITGVSKTPVAKIQNVINKSPDGFPASSLSYQTAQKPVTASEEVLIGNWNWYSKKISYADKIDYPSALKTTEAFLASGNTSMLQNKPAIFLKNKTGRITLNQFSPAEIKLSMDIQAPDTLIVLQNFFPGWQAWVNEKKAAIRLYKNNFIQLPVNENTKRVRFRFSLF